MNYITELAYVSHIAQTSKTARDKRQKNQYQQSELLVSDYINDLDSDASILIECMNTTIWQGKNRRAGNDRREIKLSRGRYLESRSTKDRRYSAELYVKI